MLTRIDRVQLAVPDRRAAATGWVELLAAQPAGDDRVKGLAALRSRYRLGAGWLELLEPDGAGPLADAVARRGAHLFAAGAATRDVDALAARLRERGVEAPVEGGQIHLDAAATGGRGLRVVVSPDRPLPGVGAVDALYEVTQLAGDVEDALARLVDLFGLDRDAFVPIRSEEYGYAGTLALFDPDRLDRFEVISPTDPARTMGRFFARHGESLYMAFAESGDLAGVEGRAAARGVGFTAVPAAGARDARGAHTVFLHPPALGGMMLGLSRPGWAWTWSGRPERAEAGA